MRTKLLVLMFVTALAAVTLTADSSDTIPADGGDIQVTPIMRTGVQIEYAGKVIQVDPLSKYDDKEIPYVGKFEALKPADLILVSDLEPDNFDVNEIVKIRKPGAPVVMPAAVAALPGGKIAAPTTTMANGDMATIAGISIQALPMYNLQHGPKPGEVYHPKGRGNGYILTLGGKRLYFMGDTECTPEVRALKNIDVAFVPMNMPYTMTPADAVECVMALQPKIVYPYHYEGQRRDETLFRAFLKGTPVEVRINTKG
jgi:L-ascorbate metabolism protein UlaG (beta-lactamase superfamily)